MKPQRLERQFLIGTAIAVCLVIAASALFAVLRLREGVQSRLNDSTQNLAVSVRQAVEGMVDTIDVALLASSVEIGRVNASGHADGQAISEYLDLQAKHLPHVAYLRGTDANGDVVYGSGRPSNTVNLSDREFFKHLRDDPKAGIYMTKPVVAKITGKPVIAFARRINRADGEFAGTVYASIYVDEFSALLAQIKMQPGGSIALRAEDMSLLTRTVFGRENPIPMGSTEMSTGFTHALQRDPMTGTYVSDSSADPVTRTYSYQTSAKYKFLVNVGLPMEEGFTAWRHQALVVFALAALLCLAVWFMVQQTLSSRARLETLVTSLEESRSRLEQKHLQLVETEQQRHSLLNNLHIGLVVHSPDSSITFSNAQAAALLKLTQEQMLGKSVVDPLWCLVDSLGEPLAPEDFPASKVIRTLRAVDAVELGVKAPGQEDMVWLEVSAFPEFTDRGTLKQVVVNFYEVTIRRQAEQARQRVARALRLVTDTNFTLSAAVNKTQLLQDICTLLCEKGGYRMVWVGYAQQDPEHSVLPMAHAGINSDHPDNAKVSWSDASPFGNGPTGIAIRTGRTQVNLDYDNNPLMLPWRQYAAQHGHRSSISLPFTKKTGVRATLTIYSGLANDFSADEVVLLEELVSNVAHELDALEDRQRRFEAESASKAKAAFLANMSHEIRTPLNAITGMSHLIRRDSLTPMQSDKLDKLEHASHHLLNIINDILDLSKIDADKLTLELAPLRIESVVSNVVSMVNERAQSKHIELTTKFPALPNNLEGDVTRLQQALLNYVTNAIKFTDAGQVTLSARVIEEDADSADRKSVV